MGDYISRQAAIEGFYEMSSNTDYLCTVEDYVHFLEFLSSVDAVKVVRCKDCKYYYYADNRIPSERGWACANDGCYVSQNDYCSWGERIDG